MAKLGQVVRFACRACPHMGCYRRVALAESFGADADNGTGGHFGELPRQLERRPEHQGHAYYPDDLAAGPAG